MKKIEKITNANTKYVNLEKEGDMIEGVLIEKTTMETKYGEREILKFIDDEGEIKIIVVSAGLRFYNWEKLIKKRIRIVFIGMKKNERTKRYYKEYEVYDMSE